MTPVESAILFWEIVRAALVELYRFDPETAEARISKLRGKMTPRAIGRDLTYHWQPVQVAANIANSFEAITDEQLAVYDKIVQRLLEPFLDRLPNDPGVRAKREILREPAVAGESLFAVR